MVGGNSDSVPFLLTSLVAWTALKLILGLVKKNRLFLKHLGNIVILASSKLLAKQIETNWDQSCNPKDFQFPGQNFFGEVQIKYCILFVAIWIRMENNSETVLIKLIIVYDTSGSWSPILHLNNFVFKEIQNSLRWLLPNACMRHKSVDESCSSSEVA